MLYVGDKQAVLYKGDFHPAALYKGGQMIAGYDEQTYTGTEIAVTDTYNDNLDLTVFGRSEQKQTVQSENIFDQDKWREAQFVINTYKGCDISSIMQSNKRYSAYVKLKDGKNPPVGLETLTVSRRYIDPNKTNADGYGSPQGFVHIFYVRDELPRISRLIPLGLENEKTFLSFYPSTIDKDEVFDAFDICIAQMDEGLLNSYEPFVPDSPSPDYPSPIHSAFDDGGQLIVTGSRPQQTISPPVLRAIPVTSDYPDPTYIDALGQAWVADEWRSNRTVERRIGVKVFDGTEPWSTQMLSIETLLGLYVYMVSWGWLISDLLRTTSGFCSVASIGLSGAGGQEPNTFSPNASFSNFLINVEKSRFPSLDDWLVFLTDQHAAGTPVTVQYILATPTTEAFAQTPLHTNPHTTSIHTTTAVKPCLSAPIKTIQR